MSIIVECQCGKRFKAKDELAGKSLPCPGCGSLLTVPMRAEPIAQPPPRPAAKSTQPTVYPGYPTSKRSVGQQQKTGRFAVTRGQVIFIALLILIPTVLFLFKIGPSRAMTKWMAAKPDIEVDVTDVINRFMEKTYKDRGIPMLEPRQVPHVNSVVLDEPVMFLTFPKTVDFQGQSTDGNFSGTYETATHHVKARVDVRLDTLDLNATIQGGNVTYDP